jgi:penicillin-binding protein 2
MLIHNHPAIAKDLNKKVPLAVTFIVVCFFFIFFRLWYLQILKGLFYDDLSTNNRIRVIKIRAPRGFIYARHGEVLAENLPSFDLTLIPQDTPDKNLVLAKTAAVLQAPIEALQKKLTQGKGRPPFEPIVLSQNLSWQQMSTVLAHKIDLPGINIEVVPQRRYRLAAASSHLLGHLGEIDQKELKQDFYSNYARGELIGKCGIEKWGEEYLRGENGGYQTEVDALGNKKNILAQINPTSGSDLLLTIDYRAQQAAEEQLQGKTGAVVAMDPMQGDVFALASSPGFDPNLFSRNIDQAEWEKLIKNPFNPLLNRALQSQQPPGSVFKLVVAIAALEEGLVDPEKQVFCSGSFSAGSHVFRCWRKEGHGAVNLRRAIVESCDVYFYQLGSTIGIDNIAKYATMLGLGEKTGIDLDDEKSGVIPSPAWKAKRFGTSWHRGETINTAIGQGYVLTTPLQIAAAFCGIANGSFVPRPRLVSSITEGSDVTPMPVFKRKEFQLAPRTVAFIKDALSGVVNEPRGTGSKARIEGLTVAGKTGTAQVISAKAATAVKNPDDWDDHAWFVAFAPAEDPKIVVSVLIEHGGHGGSTAAPIAKKVIEAFYNSPGTAPPVVGHPDH